MLLFSSSESDYHKVSVKRLLCLTILSIAIPVVHSAAITAYQAPDSASVPPETTHVGMLLAQANDYAQRQFDNQKALELYSEALVLESGNDEILWRISRAYVDIAEHMPVGNEEEKEKQLFMYEKALEFANKSVERNPNSSMALTRRAVATGRVALSKGMWTSIGMMKDMREDLEKAISLDSANHAAYYALGRTHIRVIDRPFILRWPLGLGWGSMDEAIKNFERAITLREDFVLYRLECARAYLEEGELEKARAQLTAIFSLPTLDEDDEVYRKDARELLDKMRSEEENEEK